MATTVERIVAEAMELPPRARAFVAEKLIESLDLEPSGELSAEWRREVDKRCREVDEGLVVLRDAQAAFDYRIEHDERFLRKIAKAREEIRKGQFVPLEELPD